MHQKVPEESPRRFGMARNNNHAKLETKLDKGVQALLGKGPADYPPEDWRTIREHLRLQVLYPGRFVIFRDHYQMDGDDRWLIKREVVHTARSMAAVQKWLAPLPEEELDDLHVLYIEKEPANWM